MAIPQWVPGTRLYPLVPPLPVLLESVTTGPPPFRGKTECIRQAEDDAAPRSGHDQDDAAVADEDLVRLHREIRGQRQGPTGGDVESRAMPRAGRNLLLAV